MHEAWGLGWKLGEEGLVCIPFPKPLLYAAMQVDALATVGGCWYKASVVIVPPKWHICGVTIKYEDGAVESGVLPQALKVMV